MEVLKRGGIVKELTHILTNIYVSFLYIGRCI